MPVQREAPRERTGVGRSSPSRIQGTGPAPRPKEATYTITAVRGIHERLTSPLYSTPPADERAVVRKCGRCFAVGFPFIELRLLRCLFCLFMR